MRRLLEFLPIHALIVADAHVRVENAGALAQADHNSRGRVAQLVRAPRLHRGGPGFESLRAHHSIARPMSRRRFFVPQVSEAHAEIAGEEARHLTQVLRVEPGQMYEISDNQSVYLAEIESARKSLVEFRVLERLADPISQIPVVLLVALFKFDRLELLLEKATELGVTSVRFVRAERSDKGLEKAAEKRIERWRRIAMEASQQSRRLRIPDLYEPVRFNEAILTPATSRLFLDEDRTGIPVIEAVPRTAESVALLVGPEGGWPEHERTAARNAGWTSVSLGEHILRAETAAIAGLAVVNAILRR